MGAYFEVYWGPKFAISVPPADMASNTSNRHGAGYRVKEILFQDSRAINDIMYFVGYMMPFEFADEIL